MNNSLDVFETHLKSAQRLHVQQVWEGFEIVLGWETRNKYRILDENLRPVAFAAEQSKGIGAAIMRQFFGHWRPFEIAIFNEDRQPMYILDLPFRWFFKTLFVKNNQGKSLGYLQERFAIFRKKFDVYDSQGKLIAHINSSFFKFWTFEFFFQNRKLGTVQKKWSGALGELFTDKDNFVVSYADPSMDTDTKTLMMATCLMVDIIYFEEKGRGGFLSGN